jgi:hypothetical protein
VCIARSWISSRYEIRPRAATAQSLRWSAHCRCRRPDGCLAGEFHSRILPACMRTPEALLTWQAGTRLAAEPTFLDPCCAQCSGSLAPKFAPHSTLPKMRRGESRVALKSAPGPYSMPRARPCNSDRTTRTAYPSPAADLLSTPIDRAPGGGPGHIGYRPTRQRSTCNRRAHLAPWHTRAGSERWRSAMPSPLQQRAGQVRRYRRIPAPASPVR